MRSDEPFLESPHLTQSLGCCLFNLVDTLFDSSIIFTKIHIFLRTVKQNLREIDSIEGTIRPNDETLMFDDTIAIPERQHRGVDQDWACEDG